MALGVIHSIFDRRDILAAESSCEVYAVIDKIQGVENLVIVVSEGEPGEANVDLNMLVVCAESQKVQNLLRVV